MCKGSGSVFRHSRKESVPVNKERSLDLCPQARTVPLLFQIGITSIHKESMSRWIFSVGEFALVRTRHGQEWLKVEQRRVLYGRNAYMMEDGMVRYETDLIKRAA